MPYHPPLKIGSVEPFWPKIGHWEKMRYLFKMISTRPFPINLALIHPRHNPEGPWHPPDTQQTPYRQPKMHVFWPKTEKEHQLNITTLIHYSTVFNFYDKYTPQTLARWGKTPSRHPQTPPRHPTYTPKFSTFWLRLVTGRKGNSLIWQLLFNCLWFIWHLYSPRHLPDTPRYDPDTVRHPQTPSRHPPDISTY